MKAVILYFSPTGNTALAAQRLAKSLEQAGVTVQQVDVTRQARIFREGDPSAYLNEVVKAHDVLFVGGPVYAHHMQYHVLDLIRALPAVGGIWGACAFPFVTYGGLNSGIALEEAGELLAKSGRTVLSGMKIAAAHTMTRAFMGTPVNQHLAQREYGVMLQEAVRRVLSALAGSPEQQAESLKYQSREAAQKANTVFVEKVWHASRYPTVGIDDAACTRCGKCARSCPVMHLISDSGRIVKAQNTECIHCFSCVAGCPAKAVHLSGNPEEAKRFMGNMMSEGNEVPAFMLYPTTEALLEMQCNA